MVAFSRSICFPPSQRGLTTHRARQQIVSVLEDTSIHRRERDPFTPACCLNASSISSSPPPTQCDGGVLSSASPNSLRQIYQIDVKFLPRIECRSAPGKDQELVSGS